MKRPDLLVLIAVWMFLSAFGIFIGIAAVSSVFFFAYPWMWWGHGMWNGWGMWDMPQMGGIALVALGIAILIMVAYFVLALMGGIGLLRGREWGRILSIVHAALSLFWVPVGTVIGVLILIYLTKNEVKEYFEAST
jgi:hypothetical protein